MDSISAKRISDLYRLLRTRWGITPLLDIEDDDIVLDEYYVLKMKDRYEE